MEAHLNAVATATPPHEAHGAFLNSLPLWVRSPELVEKVNRIARGAAIDRRFTVLESAFGPAGGAAFYTPGDFPSTGRRMEIYRREAPALALRAVENLRDAAQDAGGLERVTHLIVTSCTGFYAPGLDIDLVKSLGLSPSVKRTLIGFMGCYAALTGLRAAREIVQADAEARVLMVNVELCTLHLQQTERIDRLVSSLLFADGAAASLISAKPRGLRLDEAWSALSLADADDMTWNIEDQGFAMTLDARVPAKIRRFIEKNPDATGSAADAGPDDAWAVHPGGRMILDSVQEAFGLSDAQMRPSRDVLRNYGNMSSASVMFVLKRLLREAGDRPVNGHALAFGPGLTVEGVDFTVLPAERRETGAASRPEPAERQPAAV